MSGLTLAEKIQAIFELQQQGGYIVTGLHLTSEEVDALSDELSADEPPTGAIGRYRTIPVYNELAAGSFGPIAVHTPTGIRYSFVKMDIVN